MRTMIAAVLVVASVGTASADYVSGYYRKDGVYVAPHYRSNPDSSRLNNYSTQGNVNPYTGQRGTVNPYTPPQPAYGNTTGWPRRW